MKFHLVPISSSNLYFFLLILLFLSKTLIGQNEIEGITQTGLLTMVDLAGSENVGKAGTAGNSL